MTKKTKIIVATIITVLVVAIGVVSGIIISQSNSKAIAQKKIEAYTASLTTGDIHKKISSFQDEQEIFLAADLKQEAVDAINKDIVANQKEVTTLSEKFGNQVASQVTAFNQIVNLQTKKLDIISQKLTLQTAVNGLFSKSAINGSKVDTSTPIADKVDDSKVAAVTTQIKKVTGLPGLFYTSLLSLTTAASNQIAAKGAVKTYGDGITSLLNTDWIEVPIGAANTAQFQVSWDPNGNLLVKFINGSYSTVRFRSSQDLQLTYSQTSANQVTVSYSYPNIAKAFVYPIVVDGVGGLLGPGPYWYADVEYRMVLDFSDKATRMTMTQSKRVKVTDNSADLPLPAGYSLNNWTDWTAAAPTYQFMEG